MSKDAALTVAIVDLEVGNLFSVAQACRRAGFNVEIAREPAAIEAADAIVLPGVGAFRRASEALHRAKLFDPIRMTEKPLFGICLGMQLLVDESYENGRFEGLGMVPGTVVQLPPISATGDLLRVPHMGWSAVSPADPNRWDRGLMAEQMPGEPMYFVHSYYVQCKEPTDVVATSEYGGTSFCSVLQRGQVFGCQFHPERSGFEGLRLYEEFYRVVEQSLDGQPAWSPP